MSEIFRNNEVEIFVVQQLVEALHRDVVVALHELAAQVLVDRVGQDGVPGGVVGGVEGDGEVDVEDHLANVVQQREDDDDQEVLSAACNPPLDRDEQRACLLEGGGADECEAHDDRGDDDGGRFDVRAGRRADMISSSTRTG